MSFSVVWLDLEHANIFHFSEDQMRRERIRASRIDHHTHRLEGNEHDCIPMYDEIADVLGATRSVLVIGPGIAKYHLIKRLEDKYPQVAKKLVGCEVVDHPTDNEIAAYARRYFSKPVKKASG